MYVNFEHHSAGYICRILRKYIRSKALSFRSNVAGPCGLNGLELQPSHQSHYAVMVHVVLICCLEHLQARVRSVDVLH